MVIKPSDILLMVSCIVILMTILKMVTLMHDLLLMMLAIIH